MTLEALADSLLGEIAQLRQEIEALKSSPPHPAPQNEIAELRREIEALKAASPRIGPGCVIDELAFVDPSCTFTSNGPGTRIQIGQHTKVWRGAEWLGPITVGKRVFINQGSYLRPNVVIGDDVSLGQFVRLITDTHDISAGPRRTGTPRHYKIQIGDGTWIGAGATVLAGVTIGKRCIIAAGAVVTTDIPDNTLAAGVPAKVIRLIDDVDGQAILRKPEQ